MIREIINDCQRLCCQEWYMCEYYNICERFKKTAKKLGIWGLPYDWSEKEISIIEEYTKRIK